MKDSVVKDILVVAAFSALSYVMMRNYQKRKKARKQMRDFVHFQLF